MNEWVNMCSGGMDTDTQVTRVTSDRHYYGAVNCGMAKSTFFQKAVSGEGPVFIVLIRPLHCTLLVREPKLNHPIEYDGHAIQ